MFGSESDNTALLPTGLHDVLPPDAAHEAATIERLVGTFAQFGYERVKPPLMEFESTLLGDAKSGLAEHIFRVMDPVSQRMMGVRADMTLQVARIAATRLAQVPRPLRLSYAGQVLRVTGTQLRPERQFAQAGVELIGADSVAADVEALQLALRALTDIGVPGLSIDLNVPALAASVLDELALSPSAAPRVRAALDRKDVAAVRELGGSGTPRLLALVSAAGPADIALTRLDAIALPSAAQGEVDRLREVVSLLRTAGLTESITIDPVEYRGFEYQTGVSFTIFAAGARGELGRGGRYVTTIGEPATGFTLFLDSLMRAVPAPVKPPRVFVPYGAPAGAADRLRADGWVTVSGLEPADPAEATARRLACSHMLSDAGPVALTAKS